MGERPQRHSRFVKSRRATPQLALRGATDGPLSAPRSQLHHKSSAPLPVSRAILCWGHPPHISRSSSPGPHQSLNYYVVVPTGRALCSGAPVRVSVRRGYRIIIDIQRLPGAPLEVCCSIGL
ncbi:hypothetical protein NDU88_001865 [Pleurodeles waltl]|uniref:Uncharacterized protein n=1 Tax=Pleurodeles waltl TaxID=8319 RepID=A0AAV7RE77_PLEWA|nr:hypothetical protein NDU88_001865 [Pleurodeles waltl]